MPLSALVLLNIIHKHLQTAVDSAVIQVESVTPNLNGFSAAFMLAGVDSAIENVKNLIVSGEQRSLEDLGIATVDFDLEWRSGYNDAGVDDRNVRSVGIVVGETGQRGRERQKIQKSHCV